MGPSVKHRSSSSSKASVECATASSGAATTTVSASSAAAEVIVVVVGGGDALKDANLLNPTSLGLGVQVCERVRLFGAPSLGSYASPICVRMGVSESKLGKFLEKTVECLYGFMSV